ncbi:hypothetical protein BJV77DRAFT_1034387 [Russula vinacea]|nr:hypothetical protein BJV77DRAFT_1034387 [Russula vinacea]
MGPLLPSEDSPSDKDDRTIPTRRTRGQLTSINYTHYLSWVFAYQLPLTFDTPAEELAKV